MTVTRWLGWASAVLLLVMLVSGYGISEFRTVTAITMGVLSKPASQNLHLFLGVPLLIALSLHVGAAFWERRHR